MNKNSSHTVRTLARTALLAVAVASLGFSSLGAHAATGPAAGTVTQQDSDNDTVLNAAELDDNMPSLWINADPAATYAKLWFETQDATITDGCGPWTVAATGNGFLNGTCAASLPEGKTWTFRAQWFDALDNGSDIVSSPALLKDTTGPAISFTSPSAGQVAPSFKVAGSTDPSTTITLKEGTTSLGSSTATAGGSWSVAISNLTEGAHTLVASAVDQYGNPSSASLPLSVNTLVPMIASPTAGALTSGVTTVNGAGKPGSSIQLFELNGTKTTLIGSGSVGSSGTWGLHTAFSTGSHTIEARGVSGNTASSFSETRSFSADASAPTVAIDNPSPDVNPDNVTGVATDNVGVVRVKLVIYNDITGAVAEVKNAICATCGTAAISAPWTYDPSTLGVGIFRVEATAIDEVGQASSLASDVIVME